MIAPAQADQGRCDECGYRLRGLTVTRCPECGTEFDPNAAPQADIPWLRRAELGVVTAYVQTLSMILTKPHRFAAELCRPVRVSAEDAYEFRLLSIFIGSAAILLGVIALVRDELSLWPMTVVPWLVAVWVIVVAGLRLASDIPTFIWRGLPRRKSQLSPLHQYACAPLALLPIVAVPWALGFMVFEADMVDAGGQVTPAAWIFVSALVLPIMVLAWVIPVRFMNAATHDRERVRLLAVYLPVHWLIVFGMIGLLVSTAMHLMGIS